MTFPARLKPALGYAAFGIAAFVLGLYLTFPYDSLKRYVVGQAQAQGLQVQIGSMGPGLFGVTASGVKVAANPTVNVGDAVVDVHTPPLQLDSVLVRPALFPLGVALRGSAMGGSFNAHVGGLSDLIVHAEFSDLDPSKGNFKGLTGIAAKGTASGELDLDLPRTAPGMDGKPHDPNLAEATGGITLALSHFSIEGGQVTVPMYGTPTPVDLPRIALGNLDGQIDIQKGNAKLEKLSAKSDDLELNGSGTVRLARRIEYSEANLTLKLKAEPEFVKRLGLLGSGLTMLPMDPGSSGFRVAHITGFLGSPTLAPAR